MTSRTATWIPTPARTALAIPALSLTLRPVEPDGTTRELDVVEEISEVVEVLKVRFGEEGVGVVGLEGVEFDEEIDDDVDWATDGEVTPAVAVACESEVVINVENVFSPNIIRRLMNAKSNAI
jgi:hypothetical protein